MGSKPRALTEAEKDTIRRCLVAVLDGPFIDDWEFKTRLGFDRMTLRSILSARPYLDCNSEDPIVQQEVKSIFSTWGALRGEPF